VEAFLAWLASQGASLLLGFVANIITTTLRDRQAGDAQRNVGAAETAAAINAKTAETTDAMARVAANPPADDAVADRLRSGTF
jgi:hypothetical protein